jgi:hypothetical protein
MKIAILSAAAALALCAGSAGAQSFDGSTTILCLDVSGKNLPPTCHSGTASRLEKREDICTCPMGGDRVTVPVCPEGVKPPAESAAYEKARHAAVTKGSLVGQTYQGKPMCVIGRNREGY